MIPLAQFILWLQFAAILVSTLFYYILTGKKQYANFQAIARGTYYGFTGLTTVASVLLMYFFLSHNFKLEYVAQYSSSDLPLQYLISSFWAGQEGSFLLWVLISAWLGIFLMKTSVNNENHVMTLYNLQNLFLAILLIKQSPFRLAIHQLPDGFGLNMLLQDPWMVIHPPIVFIGYAAYAIPFAQAMSSLWRRDFDWIKQGLPWVSFAFLTLGAGIIIGGVWSYKVLGWGGYWGWDPVENASLLPWLAGTALLHGMLLQNGRKQLAKTNYFLAALAFVLVIYSTFLTRSGVLADFSVHSFTDLGITGLLVLFIGLFLVISVFLIITRIRQIPGPGKESKEIPLLSLEFGLIAAVILLCLSAILTGLGTSAPLITRVTDNPSKVSTDFYVNVNLPIAVIIGLLLGIIPVLKWGRNESKQIIARIIAGLVTATIVAALTFMAGFPGVLTFLMIVFAAFAVGVNLELIIRLLRKSLVNTTAAIAHFGLGLMFVAFVASTVYDQSQRVSLPQGETVSVMGYKLTFQQAEIRDHGKGTKYVMPVKIEKGSMSVIGNPDIYVEAKGRGENQQFHHPYIIRGWWSDLYVSPEVYDPAKTEANGMKHLSVKKGETISVEDYSITFLEYDLSNMNNANGKISVGADLQVSYKGQQPVALKPVYVINEPDAPQSRIKLPGEGEAFLTITAMNASDKTINLHFTETTPQQSGGEAEIKPAVMYAEVSTKPGMLLLWVGVTLLLVGGALSIYRRWPKATKNSP
ncbi:cytochrome c biogenesis protein CcsA [candidate division KSB1 bacterium]|nr:cytochrome c biogenesis protein CcsA [candidate division KSB1 bacterium]